MYSVLCKTVNRKKALQVSYQHHTMVFSTKEQKRYNRERTVFERYMYGCLVWPNLGQAHHNVPHSRQAKKRKHGGCSNQVDGCLFLDHRGRKACQLNDRTLLKPTPMAKSLYQFYFYSHQTGSMTMPWNIAKYKKVKFIKVKTLWTSLKTFLLIIYKIKEAVYHQTYNIYNSTSITQSNPRKTICMVKIHSSYI